MTDEDIFKYMGALNEDDLIVHLKPKCELCATYNKANKITLGAIREIKNGEVKTYKNYDEMIKELNLDRTR